MQELWEAVPDPIKAASIVALIGLFTYGGLALSLAFWQFVHPPTAKKIRSLFFEDETENKRGAP